MAECMFMVVVVLVELSMISFISHNRLAALLCYPACGSLYYSTLDDGGVTIYILDQGLWSLHCLSATR